MKNKFDVAAALRLRGMRVISNKNKVIQIAHPSRDFKQDAIEIIENVKGIRRRCHVIQFAGFCVRWNEE